MHDDRSLARNTITFATSQGSAARTSASRALSPPLLQQVWFATLVAWSAGISSRADGSCGSSAANDSRSALPTAAIIRAARAVAHALDVRVGIA
jgi:hypothetical protein